MVEMGQRDLPKACRQRLTVLKDAAAQMKGTVNSELPNTATTSKWVKNQQQKHKTNKQLLSEKKEGLDKQMLDCRQWLEATAPLEKHALFTDDSSMGLQLKLSKRKMLEKRDKLQFALAKLQMKLDILDAAIASADMLLINGQE